MSVTTKQFKKLSIVIILEITRFPLKIPSFSRPHGDNCYLDFYYSPFLGDFFRFYQPCLGMHI